MKEEIIKVSSSMASSIADILSKFIHRPIKNIPDTIHKVTGQVAQGDMLITPCDKIPDGFNKANPESDGVHILTHSETGHHHVMASTGVDFYQAANDSFVAYIDVKKETVLRHLREQVPHKTMLFPVGLFRINRQGEQTPKGWERVAD